MYIKYQTILNNYPTIQKFGFEFVMKLEPLTMNEIVDLESTYNNGIPFPTSLREVLFLAGKYCYVLDYGIFNDQATMQTKARTWLTRSNFIISRPFFVIDVYNASDQFLFVYLDEDQNDPTVYEVSLGTQASEGIIESLSRTLSEYVTYGVKELLSGQNPF